MKGEQRAFPGLLIWDGSFWPVYCKWPV